MAVSGHKRRAMTSRAVPALALLLAACAGSPEHARSALIGMDRSDLIACAGVPDMREALPDGEVLEWRQDQQVQGPFTIKAPFSIELDVSGHGTCHFVARLREGRVSQVEYTGPSSTLMGPYSACQPLVLACEQFAALYHRK